MKTTLILAGVLAFSAAIGAHAATGVKQAGAAILIDGKVYYLPRPASVASPFALNARRGAGGQPAAPALKRGDVLQPASQPESATATGLILAQLMPHAQSAAVARDHGLTVSFTMQNVVVSIRRRARICWPCKSACKRTGGSSWSRSRWPAIPITPIRPQSRPLCLLLAARRRPRRDACVF